METNTLPDEQAPQSKMKLFMIGGLVILIVIVILGIVLVGTKKTNTTDTNADTSTSNQGTNNSGNSSSSNNGSTGSRPEITSNIDISKSVLAWLNQEKDSKGVYYGQVTCHSTGNCDKPIATYQSGVTSIWGRFKNYQKNKDKDDLAILVKDLQTYGTTTNVFSLQNYSLNCRLMYELSQSSAFSSEQQSYIKRICFHSQPYPPIENNTPFSIAQVMAKEPLTTDNSSIVADNLIYYANDTSDYVARYEWTKDNVNIDGAKESFGYALSSYAKSNYSSSNRGTAMLGVAALDLYRITQDTQYFNLVNSIFNSLNNTSCSTTESCANTAYFAARLDLLYNKPQYKKLYDQSMKILEASSYDAKGQTGFKTGVGAFRPINNSTDPQFDVSVNGFIIGVRNML